MTTTPKPASVLTAALSEAQVKTQILNYLAIRGIFHRRRNTGAMAGEYKGKKRFVRFNSPGEADIWGIFNGRHFEIEVKGPRGKLSPFQTEFLREAQANGAITLVARSLDDVIEALKG